MFWRAENHQFIFFPGRQFEFLIIAGPLDESDVDAQGEKIVDGRLKAILVELSNLKRKVDLAAEVQTIEHLREGMEHELGICPTCEQEFTR